MNYRGKLRRIAAYQHGRCDEFPRSVGTAETEAVVTVGQDTYLEGESVFACWI